MTDAETIAELRKLLAERDAEIEASKKARKQLMDRMLWEAYRIGKPPWESA